MKWLSPPSGNSDESKADVAGATSYPFRIWILPNSERRRFHSLPVPAIPGVPFAYCRYLDSKNFPKSLQAIRNPYCSMPESTYFCLTSPGAPP